MEKLIVDVRTEQEFEMGKAPESINIPLSEVPHRLEYLKSLDKHILFCCASGGRSHMATIIGQSQGLDCSNAGSYVNLLSQ